MLIEGVLFRARYLGSTQVKRKEISQSHSCHFTWYKLKKGKPETNNKFLDPLLKEKHLMSLSSWCAKASRPKRHGWCKRKRPSQELRWDFNNCRGFTSILSFSYIRPTFGSFLQEENQGRGIFYQNKSWVRAMISVLGSPLFGFQQTSRIKSGLAPPYLAPLLFSTVSHHINNISQRVLLPPNIPLFCFHQSSCIKYELRAGWLQTSNLSQAPLMASVETNSVVWRCFKFNTKITDFW